MSSGFLTPTEESLLTTLQFLYGEDLEVSASSAPESDKALWALYVSADGTPVAVASCDVAFGCYAGASLSMIPAGGAQDAAESGEISAGMLENLKEVMNICSNLMMDDSTPHLKFEKVYNSANDLPDAGKALLDSASGPAFQVTIPGYGSGVISLMS